MEFGDAPEIVEGKICDLCIDYWSPSLQAAA